MFETIEKISFLGGQENGPDFENEEKEKKEITFDILVFFHRIFEQIIINSNIVV